MDSTVLSVLSIGVLLSGALAFLCWQFIALFVDLLKDKNERKLKLDIETAIKNGRPSWDHVKTIESTYMPLNNNSLKVNLNRILKENVLAGTQAKADNIALLEVWLEKQKSDEPFEGIPPELKLPLERIRKEAPEHQHLLEVLVSQLQEVNEKSLTERKRKSIVATLSLVFGIAGFLVGAYQIYMTDDLPNNSVQETAEVPD